MASGSKKVIYAALVGNSLIAVTKFVAAALTGSSAMLSEGVHSLADTGNQILLLYGLRRAKLPADASFPFGHGKEICFWCFVVVRLPRVLPREGPNELLTMYMGPAESRRAKQP